MGQNYGKFSVPHVNSKPVKVHSIEPTNDQTNGDVMNGSLQTADIPPITEPDTPDESSKANGEVKQEIEEVTRNGDVKDDGLLKKAKKRASSWRFKTFTKTKSSNKQQKDEEVSKTDENNNVEDSETQPSQTESAEPTSELATDTSNVESSKKNTKTKSSFKEFIKRASSLTSKKSKTSDKPATEEDSVESKNVSDHENVEPTENLNQEDAPKEKEAIPLPERNEQRSTEQSMDEVIQKVDQIVENAIQKQKDAELTDDNLEDLEQVISKEIANLNLENTIPMVNDETGDTSDH